MFTIQVNDAAVVARFSGLGSKVHGAVARFVRRFGFEFQRAVQSEKLSGQVLKVRTGTLRSSIGAEFVDSPSWIATSIGTNVRYAGVHEYGFRDTVSVRAHLRMVTQAFGRSIRPAVQHVSAHERHMNLPERSFLRSTLREKTPAFVLGVESAAEQELQR